MNQEVALAKQSERLHAGPKLQGTSPGSPALCKTIDIEAILCTIGTGTDIERVFKDSSVRSRSRLASEKVGRDGHPLLLDRQHYDCPAGLFSNSQGYLRRQSGKSPERWTARCTGLALLSALHCTAWWGKSHQGSLVLHPSSISASIAKNILKATVRVSPNPGFSLEHTAGPGSLK